MDFINPENFLLKMVNGHKPLRRCKQKEIYLLVNYEVMFIQVSLIEIIQHSLAIRDGGKERSQLILDAVLKRLFMRYCTVLNASQILSKDTLFLSNGNNAVILHAIRYFTNKLPVLIM